MDKPCFDNLVRELLATWERADAPTLTAGAAWYPAAHLEARRLARIAPAGVGVSRAAAIIAALSPRTQWSVNLRWAEAIVHAAQQGQPCPAVGTRSMRRKAWAIAQGGDPSRELSGPKVRRFWRNLCGDFHPVTVDVWAARAVGWGALELNRAGWYEHLEFAYQTAAYRVGVEPASFQAQLWLALRGAKPTDGEKFRPTQEIGCAA